MKQEIVKSSNRDVALGLGSFDSGDNKAHSGVYLGYIQTHATKRILFFDKTSEKVFGFGCPENLNKEISIALESKMLLVIHVHNNEIMEVYNAVHVDGN